MPRKNIAHLGADARKRGAEIEKAVLTWVFRWDFVSDRSLRALILDRFGVDRPRYGYRLWKKGLLRRHKRKPGFSVPGVEYVYSLPNDERRRRAEKGHSFWAKYHGQRKIEPAWSTMAHLLKLQEIAAQFISEHRKEDRRFQVITEPETRRLYAGRDVIPDLVVMEMSTKKAVFIELERDLKSIVRRRYWASRYTELLRGNRSVTKLKGFALSGVRIYTESEEHAKLYAETFMADSLPETIRDAGTRKYHYFPGHWVHGVRETCSGVVVFRQAPPD